MAEASRESHDPSAARTPPSGFDTGDLDRVAARLAASARAVTIDSGLAMRTGPAMDPSFPTLDGYEVTGRLGAGGMGVVWRAVQLSTKREVALKLMSAATLGSARAKLRFEREVELTARLDHPNIARVYDSGIRRGIFFYAMELLEGQALDAYVTERGLATERVIELMELICRAVQHAHQKGVIHRDLKPSNVLVDAGGRPHVLDFGLAKATEGDQELSLDGEVAGTPAYMSPEQAAGKLDTLDTRSDVYTLGVILFRLLSGSLPHETSGSALELMKRIAEDEPRRLRAVQAGADAELEALLNKALEKEPERRYPSAGEMADDLRRYLDHDPLVARAPTLGYLLRKRVRRYRVPLSIAASVLMVLIGTAVWAYLRVAHERNAAIAANVEKDRQRLEAERLKTVAETQQQIAMQALNDLRGTAPTFYARAQAFVQAKDFERALQDSTYAATLTPGEAKYHRLRGDVLQSMLRFAESRDAYAVALRLAPDDTAARESAELCERLIEEQRARGEPRTATLSELQALMQSQERFAEALALQQQLTEAAEPKVRQLEQWQHVLAPLGIRGKLDLDPDNRLRLGNLPRTFSDLLPLKGIPLEVLDLSGTEVSDLSPVAHMPLTALNVNNTHVRDLRPLTGGSLRWLSFDRTDVDDLGPLSGLPLETLIANRSPVNDLSPLRNSSLVELSLRELKHNGVLDLSPLRGLRLRKLHLIRTNVTDVSALVGMPMEDLDISATRVTDFSPLRGMKPKNFSAGWTSLDDLTFLAGSPLQHLVIPGTKVKSLRPLHGTRLTEVGLSDTNLEDLEPLREMPLRMVDLSGTRVNGKVVSDLSILRGKPLELLRIARTDVTDLTPLEGMPLKELWLTQCNLIQDLSPLQKCGLLTKLSVPHQCRDVERLRRLPSLKQLEFDAESGAAIRQTAAVFWKDFDSRPRENNGKGGVK